MKLTVGIPTPRVNRKVMKGFATKRTALGQQRLTSGERMLIVYLWSIDTVAVRYWCMSLSCVSDYSSNFMLKVRMSRPNYVANLGLHIQVRFIVGCWNSLFAA